MLLNSNAFQTESRAQVGKKKRAGWDPELNWLLVTGDDWRWFCNARSHFTSRLCHLARLLTFAHLHFGAGCANICRDRGIRWSLSSRCLFKQRPFFGPSFKRRKKVTDASGLFLLFNKISNIVNIVLMRYGPLSRTSNKKTAISCRSFGGKQN